jgi:hypothetical protein
LKTRSRAGASRDDQVSGFKGRFYGDNSLFLLFVILTKVLVRISIHAKTRTVASAVLQVIRANAKKKVLGFDFNEDGSKQRSAASLDR